MDRAPPRIFDRRRTTAKWRRALERKGASYLVETMAEDIAERLAFMRVEPTRSLVIGDTTGTVPATARAVLGEIDEERPLPDDGFDLIVHLLGLGVVNDLPGALIHARHALVERGLFISAFPGAGSLPVLRQLALAADGERPAARIHPQVDIRAGTALLERAGFKRQVVDSYPLKVRFSSLDRLVGDLRDHGLSSSLASPAPPITRAGWQRAREAFDALREADGKVTESFEILVLTGWR